MSDEPKKSNGAGYAGTAAVGTVVTGLLGVLFGAFAIVTGNPVGAGLCLIASALAFGLLANALFRA